MSSRDAQKMRHWCCILFSFLFPVLASAEPLVVAPFSGPRAIILRRQVVRTVCKSVACLSLKNWKDQKIKKFILRGRVYRTKRGRFLRLDLHDTAGRRISRTRHRLSRKWVINVSELNKVNVTVGKQISNLSKVKGDKKIAKSPKAAFRSAPSSKKLPPRPKLLPIAGVSSTSSTDDPHDSQEATTENEEANSITKKNSPVQTTSPYLRLFGGVDLVVRSFSLSGLQTKNVHAYRTKLPVVALGARAELFPFVRSSTLVSGMGLFADYSHSLGLKANLEGSGGPAFPTQLASLALGAQLRLPLTQSGPSLISELGMKRTAFSISMAGDRTVLQGLPEVAYLGIRAGVGVEYPFLERRLLVWSKLAYLSVFSSGQVISTEFFSDGNTWGFEGEVGSSWRVLSSLEVRLGIRYSRYSLSLKTKPGDIYVADSATDTLVYSSLGLAYLF